MGIERYGSFRYHFIGLENISIPHREGENILPIILIILWMKWKSDGEFPSVVIGGHPSASPMRICLILVLPQCPFDIQITAFLQL